MHVTQNVFLHIYAPAYWWLVVNSTGIKHFRWQAVRCKPTRADRIVIWCLLICKCVADTRISYTSLWHKMYSSTPFTSTLPHTAIYSPPASSHPLLFSVLLFLICFIKTQHFCQYSRCSVPACWCVSTCPLSGKSSPDLTKSAPLSPGATLRWRQGEKVEGEIISRWRYANKFSRPSFCLPGSLSGDLVTHLS